jgi:uncharacterized repeat protein (TIGR02543 family)
MKAFKFMLGLLAVVQVTSAKVIYVDDDASAGGDGSSWSSAHKYLQDAIAVSEAGDEVWVAEGTYKPDQGNGITTGDRTASFTLDGISLYGGFVGSETTNNPAGSNEKTILSGEIDSNSTLWSLNVVITIGSSVSLNGVTVTKGNANGAEYYAHGGGVRGKGTFTNCTFTNNSASGSGGGVQIPFEGSLSIGGNNGYPQFPSTFTNCKFTNNSAGEGGGGISGSGTFTNCTFTNNSAGSGGGVTTFDKTSTFTNCTFTNNSASGGGGGISGSGTFTNCSFTNNSASSGGGVSGYYSSKFTNCTFTNNSASNGGGVTHFQHEMIFTNCTFTNNSATQYGGGVFVSLGIFSNSSSTFNNCILWKNSTNGVEGHGYLFSTTAFGGRSYSTSIEPVRTTEQEAIASQYPGDPNAQEAIYSYKYYKNIFQGWTENENAFSADPLFVNIDDPIGPDGIWFTADDGLRLRSGSPAIDAGNNADLPADSADLDNDGNNTEPIPSDIAGYRRIQGSAVDLGAYEYGNELMPTKPDYQVAVSSNTGGFIPSGGGTYEEGYAVTITATPLHEGWIFTGWSGDASGTSNPLTITADQDKTIVSNFAKDEADDDGDGISNFEEIVTYGTSKSSNDSDGDGLTDKEETDRGLNPNSSDRAIIDAVMELKGMKADNVTPIVSGWYYVPDQGWFWTNKDAYPYTYSATDKDWMYFQSGNDKPKFYRYKTKTWLTIE